MSTSCTFGGARHALLVALLAAFTLAEASAQSTTPTSYPNKSATELLQAYNRGAAGTAAGQEMLIAALNTTLPANDTNILAVRQSLAKASSVEDKVLLIKLLSSMYTPRVRTQQNLLIESDIKKLTESSDRKLAAEAVLEYSRLSYPSDRYQVLQRARAARVIDDDAYYGELAHGLRFAAPTQQSQMLSELEVARNAYGAEVLAATFASRELVAQLDSSARRRLFNVLSSREPDFPMALDSFGVTDMARYVIWMDAVATIESDLSGRSYADLVLGRLSAPRVDPRKILAVFSNPEGQRVIRESKDVSQLRALQARAQAYSNSLPQNALLKGAASSFSKQMAGTPAAAGQRP